MAFSKGSKKAEDPNLAKSKKQAEKEKAAADKALAKKQKAAEAAKKRAGKRIWYMPWKKYPFVSTELSPVASDDESETKGESSQDSSAADVDIENLDRVVLFQDEPHEVEPVSSSPQQTRTASTAPRSPASYVQVIASAIALSSEGFYAVEECFRGVEPADQAAWRAARTLLARKLGDKLNKYIRVGRITRDQANGIVGDALLLVNALRFIRSELSACRALANVIPSETAAGEGNTNASTSAPLDVEIIQPEGDVEVKGLGEQPPAARSDDRDDGIDIELHPDEDGGTGIFDDESLQSAEEGGTLPVEGVTNPEVPRSEDPSDVLFTDAPDDVAIETLGGPNGEGLNETLGASADAEEEIGLVPLDGDGE